MSTARRLSTTHQGYGPNGRNICFCGCRREVTGRRQNWFSDACVADWLKRSDPAVQRHHVEQRDKGVCAICKLDTDALHARMRDLNRRMVKIPRERKVKMHARLIASLPAGWEREIHLAVFGGLRWRHLWEMDHIVPVVEGGGGCDLTNLRTLCLPCHKAQTRALARRRSRAGRISTAQLDLPAVP